MTDAFSAEPGQPKQRRLGLAVMAGVAVLLALAHLARWRHHGAEDLTQAYVALGQALDQPAARTAHLREATAHLTQAAGSVVVNAEAIALLALAEQVPRHVGEPPEPPPSDHAEPAIIAHAERLLAQGHTALAVRFLHEEAPQSHATGSVRTLTRLAERWLVARKPTLR